MGVGIFSDNLYDTLLSIRKPITLSMAASRCRCRQKTSS